MNMMKKALSAVFGNDAECLGRDILDSKEFIMADLKGLENCCDPYPPTDLMIRETPHIGINVVETAQGIYDHFTKIGSKVMDINISDNPLSEKQMADATEFLSDMRQEFKKLRPLLIQVGENVETQTVECNAAIVSFEFMSQSFPPAPAVEPEEPPAPSN